MLPSLDRQANGRRPLWAIAAFLLLSLAGVGVFLAGGRAEPPPPTTVQPYDPLPRW